MKPWRIGAVLALLCAPAPTLAQTPGTVQPTPPGEACLAGAPPEAVEALCTEALALPGLADSDTAQLLAQRGNARAARRAWAEAVEDLTQALALAPDAKLPGEDRIDFLVRMRNKALEPMFVVGAEANER